MFPFMPAPAFSPNLPCTCFPPLPLPCPHPHQDTGIVSPLLTTPIPLGSLDRPCQMGTKTLPFPTQLLQQQCENKCQGYDTLGATRGSEDEGRFVYCGQRLVIFPGKGFLGVRGGCGRCNGQEMAAAWARAVMVAQPRGVCFETRAWVDWALM